ncbi:Hypothetical predicted protein [Olea europaea subsp. europaea]|uniref:Disease resistance protein At4g27190-like leucine-rich repeats domain-containing protein n=1 Tax=Olea europaea subsp. europaea TaxID=158383 RepID=A0A8S0TEB0_OLEEU|nr:Hypothetical predicted protein [Olea europaea subsp. europaea]
MVKHDIRTEWPEHDNHDSYGAISLTFQGRVLLPSRLQYGNLEFLRVRPYWTGIGRKIDIPGGFFDYMQELKVIDFSNVQIRSPNRLPPGLRTLCLNYCTLEIEISYFGSLNKLEILTFYQSSLSIDFLHNEMVELGNLRLLDLRFTEGPRPPPPGFLFGMKKLEELYLGRYFGIRYEVKEHVIKELSSLKDINTLQINTDDTRFLTQLLQGCSEELEKLERFQICKNKGYLFYHFRRELQLHEIDPNVLLEPEIKSLMRRCDKLSLEVKGWNNPVIELVEDGFSNLKSLRLFFLDSEYLTDAVGSIPSGNFRNLELLYLFGMDYLKEMHNGNLPRMEHMTRGVLEPAALFCNLKQILVTNCAKIKRMFPESVAKCMVNLQTLFISSCPSLEEVVSMDMQENEITEPPLFPKLKRVELRDLSSFVSFRSEPNAVGLRQPLLNQVELPDLETLDIFKLDMKELLSVGETPFRSPNRLSMRVEFCDNLVNIAQSNLIKLLRNLETLEVRTCRALNVIFDFEGLNVNKDAEEEISILGQLKSFDLVGGDCLVHIMRMVPKGINVFQNLKWLKVASCNRLRYLFPASMINLFVSLETLYIGYCSEIEEIFGREEEERTSSEIVFPELRRIELIDLPRFKIFCSHNYELVFPSLDLFRIQACPVMTKFCSGQLNVPKLKGVQIGKDEVIDISNFLRL